MDPVHLLEVTGGHFDAGTDSAPVRTRAYRSNSQPMILAREDIANHGWSFVQVYDSNIHSSVVVKICGRRTPGHVPLEVRQPHFIADIEKSLPLIVLQEKQALLVTGGILEVAIDLR